LSILIFYYFAGFIKGLVLMPNKGNVEGMSHDTTAGGSVIILNLNCFLGIWKMTLPRYYGTRLIY
jgi:hypothetical protein